MGDSLQEEADADRRRYARSLGDPATLSEELEDLADECERLVSARPGHLMFAPDKLPRVLRRLAQYFEARENSDGGA